LYLAYNHAFPDKDRPRFNSEHVCVLAIPPEESPALWATSVASLVCRHSDEPSRPFTSLKIGVRTGFEALGRANREDLLSHGISTWTRDETGDVRIERLVTTKTKTQGSEDLSFFNLCRRLTLSVIRFDLYHYFNKNFARKMLAQDGATGKNVLTPSAAKSLLLSRYDRWVELCWVQPSEDFSKESRCWIDQLNRDQLRFEVPLDLMGQLYSTHTTICFR
jgi:phage tail sheath gpL-like